MGLCVLMAGEGGDISTACVGRAVAIVGGGPLACMPCGGYVAIGIGTIG
eukprot:CAMPEP_0179320692 /NCGR_PEP_ID=MMETSP0797-20121207/58189_1 /TAXON_ID=47934 /ORGANISM="Dinophysis acuminata, Strain DAEP01" /LENGTH=48 /DNA_ID= /DNA_START= /DNA_END= /DNA_ORIENTATION=